ncbi:MAG: hypothetical protein UU73_C0003G0158 [Candidatus Daviesbacteria bacterium GW2011_GWA1_41_61]|uniref:Transposase n=1 Tax=Candidatus Daviesbacteria bacterium GW2011_GWA2_40_9 TaxID=1618424 RepID=A0A0G0WFT5_9BACT|nr:MAG: hypothetical protein UU26_C0003G0068 [Candidatus Daviesbacteria bacterium GW2011_GWC1_40_9]KKR83145.1 MAG: hypothetical protein UU29_C0007G0015 [Candidatus Daviesbacteria bacterium GW2011_GWA2_40_9]KKR93492.1 MAG: hypothetical protein UU44_C0002G0153 [Candidatus Daviesbacteria bacterium GW2011_GWB1_41_15]KKS14959.1 MAG: hypothetical protein UU73_C0003G0158 [Candidatus Daviesbacteria bacterium GW2011_GWA1_41_61]
MELVIQHYRKPLSEDIRLRSHSVILVSKGYTFGEIAEILLTSEQTVYRWIKAFQKERIASLFPKYLNNQHAAKLTREQKEEIGSILKQPPSDYGIPSKFWDISSLKTYIKAEFGVEYESDESYRLIFLLHNYSFHLPGTFDIHRNEQLVEKRITEIKSEIQPFMETWKVLIGWYLPQMSAG